MATRKVTPPLSFTLRDGGGRLNYGGRLSTGLELLFGRLPDALARRKVLDALEKAHAKLLREADQLDGEQRDAAQVSALSGSQVSPSMALPSRRLDEVKP